MRKILSASIAALFLFVGGCAKDQAGPAPTSDHARATSNFDQVKDPPLTPQTHFAAGRLAESQNDIPRAIQQYLKALQTDASHEPSLYRLGVLRARIKDYPAAIQTWHRYIEVTKGSAAGYANLGFCQELAGKPTEAEASYKAGIKKEPKNISCRVNYGLMLARQGRTNEATIQLQAVLSDAEVHYDLAGVYALQGKKDQARDEYRKALKIDPHFADAQTQLDALK